MNVLIALFCLGVYTLLAQMLLTRELLIIGLGNELTIGVVFSIWLVLMGVGARLYRPTPPGKDSLAGASGTGLTGGRPARIVLVFLWLAMALPAVILAVRAGAGWVRPAGEYPGLFPVFSAAFLALAPLCVPAGLVFPLACETYSRRGGDRGVSGLYAVEALGSFAGGALFSFFLIERFFVMQIVWLGVLAILVGAVCVTPRERWGKKAWAIVAFVVAMSVIVPHLPFLAVLEQQSVAWRWASMGVTRESGGDGPAVLFKGGFDTRYQNLAMTESQGLFTFYGDGQVLFSFPDDITSERAVNFVMAQKPDARRILLIGGNPAGELPYLLQYPVREVVHVERDPGIRLLVRAADADRQERLDRDPRLTRIHDDGPRFVKRCKTEFDVVLIHAPEPVTVGLNRFYTREFYEDVRGILAPGGFMHTTVEASERLERDASRMAGSIYRTLSEVFPVVRVTAGSPLHFFASGPGGSLSLDRQVLHRRSLAAGVSRTTFNPVYFLSADELAPDKIAFTEQRLKASGAPVNTLSRPVSCYYSLILWSRFSGSGLGSGLRWLGQIPGWMLLAVVGGAGLVGVILGGVARRRHPLGMARLTAGKALALTGFAGVALELILLYTFQACHGHVYSRMGLMVGLFMLGTVLGAWRGRSVETSDREAGVRHVVAGGLAGMAVLAMTVWLTVPMKATPPEWLLYGIMVAVGFLLGLQFVAATRWLVLSGQSREVAAGWSWWADYTGSALGGLLGGVFLVAIWGVATTCGLLVVALVLELGAIIQNTILDDYQGSWVDRQFT